MPIDDLDGEVMITLVQGARWVHCKGRGQGRTQQPGSGAQTLPASATTMNSLQPKSTRKNTDKNFPSLQPGFYLKKKRVGGLINNWVSLVAQPEKAMATHSSTLAWKIPWTEEPSGLQSKGSLRVGHDQVTSYFHFPLSCIGEGNGNPLQ